MERRTHIETGAIPAIAASTEVAVYTDSGLTVLATLYADDEVTPVANPVIVDANGEFHYRAADGIYWEKIGTEAAAELIMRSYVAPLAATDKLEVRLAGQAARLNGLRTDAGASLANPFTVAQAGGVNSWAVRVPTKRQVDLYHQEGAAIIDSPRLIRPAVDHFSADLTGTVPESYMYDVRVFAEITDPGTVEVQPNGTIEVTFGEAVSGVTCGGNGTGTLEATDGTSYAPSVSGSGAVYTLAAPVAGWIEGAVVTITIKPTIAAVADSAQLYDGLGFLLDVATLAPDVQAPVVTGFVIEATSADATIAITTLTATDDRAVTAYQVNTSATPPGAGAGTWQSASAWISAGYPSGLTAGQSQTITLYAWAKDAAGNVSAALSDSCDVAIPAYVASFSAQPTLTAALYDGGAFGFTVADSGSRNVDIEAWTGAAWVAKLSNVAAGAKSVTIDGLTAGSKAGLKFRVSPTGLAEWVESNAIATFSTVAPTLTSVTPGDTTNTLVFADHANDTADSFNIKWGTASGALSNTITGVTSPYTHTGRTNGVEYFYAMVAVVGGIESTPSSELSGTPAPSVTYATFDPAKKGAGVTLSNGNLRAVVSTNNWYSALLNVGKTTGKRVFAVTLVSATSSLDWMIGMGKSTTLLSSYLGANSVSISCRPAEGKQYFNGASGGVIWPVNTGTAGITFGVCIDFDARTMSIIGSDGVHDTTASSAIDGTEALFGGIGIIAQTGSCTIDINCGQSAAPFDIPAGYTWGIEA